MIDGEINPPVFDPDNWQVVARHVHAFLLTEVASSVADARLFLRRFQQDKEQYVNQVCKVFGSQPRIETYLRQEFAQALQDEIEKHSSGGFQVQLYNSGFFPDYGFRRDAICVLDAGAMQERGLRPEKMNEYDLGEHTLREYTLGERDPEQAYLDLVPGTSVFMSDNVYALAVPSTYEDFRLLVPGALDPTPVTVRSYAYLLGQEEVLHAQEDEEIARYDRLLLFDAKQQYVDRKVILQTAYHPDCALYFINGGVRKPENEIEHFHDDEEAYCFGYRLERESFILRFAGDVCGDNEIPISFASAFYNALLEHYRVDASELGLLINARPLQADDRDSFYVVIYDRTGNKALPLAQIQDEFEQVVEVTFRRVDDCPSGTKSNCDDGCYRCCKSYSLGYWSGSVKKGLARMVAGYLLGRERFVPELAEPEVVHVGYDLELNLQDQGDHFVVRSSTGRQYDAAKGESYNRSIIDLLLRSIRAEWTPETRRLRITSKLFIVDAINKGHLKNERKHFSQLQFELLRFDSVTAEKG